MWYFANILEGNTYKYPENNITLKLFHKEDANPNDYATAYKKAVFEKTITVDQIEKGPIVQNIQTYQYNWNIIPSQQEGFKEPLIPNKEYKLRIYGDGKDVQSNGENYKCYDDGDIQPGSTREFYVVENTEIDNHYYRPIPIEDDARMNTKVSLIMIFMISLFVILYHN